jgi:hypothetical protein
MLRLGAEVTCDGKLFHTLAPATGKDRSPTEDIDVSVAQLNAAMMPSATQDGQPDTERTHAGKMSVGRGWNERP